MTAPRAYVVVDPDPHPWAGACDTLVVDDGAGTTTRYALADPAGAVVLVRAIADAHGHAAAAAAARALAGACRGPA